MNALGLAVALLVLLVLGLFVVVAGSLMLQRGEQPRRGRFLVLVGLLLVGVAGVQGWRNWPLILQLFQSDENDPEALARLAGKRLGGGKEGRPDDWPQWRGPWRDGISPATGLRADWPRDGPLRLWRTPVGGGYSSPSIAGGRVWVTDKKGDEERVRCLDARNGKELGSYRYRVDYAGLDRNYAQGPRATPTVHEGRVYAVGATGVFVCLEAVPQDSTMKLLWRHDLLSEFQGKLPGWGVASSPLIEGDLVIVQPGGNKGSVVAFDRVTGKQKWTALDDPSGYSSPVAASAAGVRQVICFTAKRMVGLRASDGGLLWQYKWPTQHGANIATPIVADNYVFLSSDYGAGCALLELKPGEEGGVSARPVFVRRNKLMRNHFSACVLHDNHLYGYDVSGSSASLKCVDVRTIKEKWSTRELEKGCVLYADGRLIVLTQGGDLVLVEATPEGYKKTASAEVLEGSQCWALPALVGGRLYLRDNNHVVCLEMKK